VTCVEKGVPSFWLVAMKNNIVLAHEVSWKMYSIVNFGCVCLRFKKKIFFKNKI
jgi:hypothetical protein